MQAFTISDKLSRELAIFANTSDEHWPAESFRLLAQHGVLAAFVPEAYRNELAFDCDDEYAKTAAYIDLAAADLNTCFILTQQNSAIARLAASSNEDLKQDWLPRLAKGDAFATVGISHLSTSRQHVGRPSVKATATNDGYLLDGNIPWATSATRADVVVVGATCDDGREILAAVNTSSAGFTANPPERLLALTASETGSIDLDRVQVFAADIVAGPVEGVMKSGAGGTGSLTTSALAVGLSQRCVGLLLEESQRRDELVSTYDLLHAELLALRKDMLTDATSRPTTEELRTRANSLALRSSQALMTACKGAGFLVGHPAERAVREAMFFLVWSCPRPVASAAMQEFACRPFCS